MKKQRLCTLIPNNKRKRFFSLFCYCLLGIFCSSQLSAQSEGFNTSGSAIAAPGLGTNCFQLTEDIAPISQSGSAISICNIDLNQDFFFDFDMNFGTNCCGTFDPNNPTNVGADGMAFLLQPLASALGGIGGGIGYEGVSPSLAVEFDDFQNITRNDPAEDHIGVQRNGHNNHAVDNVIPAPGYFILPSIEDGLDHSIQISWNATTNTLQVFFDDPATPKVTVTEDFVNTIFGGNSNVFWGFTGATATFSNVQTVCLNSFVGAEILTTEITTSTGTCQTTGAPAATTGQGTATASASCGTAPFSFLWSDGQTTQTAVGLIDGNYTVTVTDALLASAIRTVTITSSPDSNNDGIADACPCTITCPTATFDVNNDAGVCGATVNIGSATSPCALTLISSNAPAIFPVGVTTVTRVFADPNNNQTTCMQTVTVTDNETPVAVCQDITIPISAAGTATITAAQIDNGSSDNCGAVTLSVTPTTFDCDDIGGNPVVLTVTSGGLSATCPATVTVTGNAAPTAVCQDITVPLNATGMATITAAQIDNGSAGCGGSAVTLSANQTAFDCDDIGGNTVTLTVVNGGLTTTCTSTVTVTDMMPPIAVCQDITVSLNAAGTVSIADADIDGGSSDNCGTITLEANPTTFDCSDVGGNSVGLTVMSGGLSATCTATVTITDTTPLSAVCQNITVGLNTVGMAVITAAQIDNGSSDNCGAVTLSVTPTTFDCDDIGANTVTLTATNGGVSATCTATVTITGIAPEITTFTSTGITCQADGGSIFITGTPNATVTVSVAGIGVVSTILDPAGMGEFNFSSVGVFTATVQSIELNGCTGTAGQTVSFTIDGPPAITCPADIVQDSDAGVCGAVVDYLVTATTLNPITDLPGFNYIGSSPDGNQYFRSIATFTWQDALQDAATNGGHLATIDNATTQTLTSNGPRSWLGLTDEIVEGQFNWITGEPLVYTAWHPAQPDDGSNPNPIFSQDYVYNNFLGAGLWDDAQSDEGLYRYILELEGGVQLFETTGNFATHSEFPIGTTNVCYNAVNECGLMDQCCFNVTVEDNELPTALCQDITVQLDAAGAVSITTGQIDNGSNDACGIMTLSLNTTDFGCADVGGNAVTLTVTDNNNNMATCNATVTVEDVTPPTALCQDITVQLDAAGAVSITTGQIDNGSNDACGIMTLSLNTTDFGCADVGGNAVTLTVTDNNNNMATCNATVTVEDVTPLSAVCQNITVGLNTVGMAVITAAQIDNGSSDNCGAVTLSVTPTTFDCDDIGANTVTLTATNGGVSATCTATVTITGIAPEITTFTSTGITCQADGGSIFITGTPNATVTVSVAGIGVVSTILDPAGMGEFNFSSVGVFTATVQSIELNGCTGTAGQTVSFTIDGPPAITCPADIVQDSDAGVCGAVVDYLVTATTLNPITDLPGFTYIGSSPDGNQYFRSIATFTWQDALQDAATNGGHLATIDNATTQTLTSNGPRSWLGLTDEIVEGQFNWITGEPLVYIAWHTQPDDGNSPNPILSQDYVYNNFSGAGLWDDAQSDHIPYRYILELEGGVQLFETTGNFATHSEFPIGTTNVCYNAVNECGLMDQCCFNVTVEDNELPTALCQDITIQLDAAGAVSITTGQIDNGSNDACGIMTLSLNTTDFGCADVGGNAVTLTVTDNNNNMATCNATVTVEDVTPPTAICQDITVQLDAAGAVSITTGQIDNGSNDACGIMTLSLNTTDFGCADVGGNAVTLTVTDNNNNMATCNATVTVEDVTPLSAVCQNITVGLNTVGMAVITAAQIDNGSSDNCGAVTLSVTPTTFDCDDIGANTVTLTATNGGVSATCTATVTITGIAPEITTFTSTGITCQADGGSIFITGTPNATVTVSVAGIGVVSTILDPAGMGEFNFSSVGVFTATVQSIELNGCTGTAGQTVSFTIDGPPAITCPADIVQDSDAGVCGAVVDYLVTATTLNPITDLPGFTYIGSSPDGNQYFRSIATFTWQDALQDAATNGGHLATIDNATTQTLTSNGPRSWLGLTDEIVEGQFNWITGEPLVYIAWHTQPDDGNSPNPILSQDYVYNNFSGAGLWDDAQSDHIPYRYILELEGGVQLFETTGNFATHSEFPIGTTNVCYNAVNECGLMDQCCFNVTVEDNELPTAICQDITVQLDAAGAVSITTGQIDNGSNDACGIMTLSLNTTDFGCADVGGNAVTLTVTDNNNNMATCNATVTVEDVTPPTALCSNVTAVLSATAPGTATITTGAVDAGSTDACGIASFSLDRTGFSCADVGTTVTVTLTVTDVNNNSATCTANVVTIDQTPPTPICQPFDAQLDANGIATVGLNNVLASASDNCGLMPGGQLTQDAFNCAELGDNMVTVSVTDVNGLTGSCDAIVTVVDLIDPTAVCQNLILDLDVNGFGLITADQIDNGSSDNCNMITLAVSQNSFFCTNVGNNPVTLVVTDQSDNEATCTANVLVRDLFAPQALCQAVTIFLDGNGNASVTPNQVDNGSNDACGIADLSLNKEDFNCSNLGQNTVVLTVTDGNGNIASCIETITVIDDMPAVILCRPPVNTVNDPGVCGADVLLLPPLVLEENCSIVSVDNDAPNLFDLGTTLVTWTIVDAGGNLSLCEQTVTIHDTEDPVIDCGNSFTAYTSWDNCGYPSSLLEEATATDNCGVISLTDDAPDFFPPGQYMVNYTATDASGNTAMCMQWVKIYDTTLPKLVTCPEDQTVFATTTTGANATWDLPTGMDNCPGDIILVEANGYEPGNFFELGDTNISYRLYDQNGQYVDCEFTISVIPAPAPLTINCLETIEVSSQNEVTLQLIAYNSPLVQSLCDDCEILKSDDFTHVGGFEGHNYYLFDSAELSWNEAEQMAHDLGGYLTVVSSYKEGLFLSTELEEDVNAWIGLADLQGNGEWTWSDDTEFEMPNWQEELTFIEDEPTAFVLNNDGEWVLQTTDESNYFLFEIPCYEFEITNDNEFDIAEVNSETTISYEVTDMCGETVSCDFQLIFTDQNVDYCNEGSMVTDSAAQHFIDRLVLGDTYTNESGNDYGYGDFTDEYILLTPGEILDIYAEFGPLDVANPLYCRIWIDLNADGDFYDEGELIGQAIDVLDMQNELTVPNINNSINETRLRIAISRFGYPEPCGTFINGEMEDYTITFDHDDDVASFMQVTLQGHREGFASHLTWVTQTSLDIDGYDVERSIDGVNFEKSRLP